jgi:hypothetical protein
MGGQNVNASQYIQPPSNVLPEQILTMGQQLGSQGLNLQNQNLMWQAKNPTQSYIPNIPGMQKLAQQEAEINAANSQALEKAMSPATAALRQSLPLQLQQDLQMASGSSATSPYRQQDLANLFGSGLQDSTIGKSAYFDVNTVQGLARRQAAEQAVQNYLAQTQAPTAGLDPGALVSAQQAGQAQAVQNRNANLQNVLGGAQANAQSVSNWINSQMANAGGAANAQQQNWQNYQQALYNAAAQNAAQQNAITGSEIGAAGTIGGAVLGSVLAPGVGTALGAGLGEAAAGAFSPSSTVQNGGPATVGGYYTSPQAAYSAYSTGNPAQGTPQIAPAPVPGLYTSTGWNMPSR